MYLVWFTNSVLPVAPSLATAVEQAHLAYQKLKPQQPIYWFTEFYDSELSLVVSSARYDYDIIVPKSTFLVAKHDVNMQ